MIPVIASTSTCNETGLERYAWKRTSNALARSSCRLNAAQSSRDPMLLRLRTFLVYDDQAVAEAEVIFPQLRCTDQN